MYDNNPGCGRRMDEWMEWKAGACLRARKGKEDPLELVGWVEARNPYALS